MMSHVKDLCLFVGSSMSVSETISMSSDSERLVTITSVFGFSSEADILDPGNSLDNSEADNSWRRDWLSH